MSNPKDIKECCQESQQVFKDLSEELIEKLAIAKMQIYELEKKAKEFKVVHLRKGFTATCIKETKTYFVTKNNMLLNKRIYPLLCEYSVGWFRADNLRQVQYESIMKAITECKIGYKCFDTLEAYAEKIKDSK